jgi:WD40 repeat protein
VWDVASGRLLHSLAGHQGRIDGLAFSPDGKRLASACLGQKVNVWDVVNGRAIAAVDGLKAPVAKLAFMPDGERITLVPEVTESAEIRDTNGRLLKTVSVQPGMVLDLSRDGQRLAVGKMETTLTVVALPGGEVVRQFAQPADGGAGMIVSAAFSSDAKYLAAAQAGGQVLLWNLASGEKVGSWKTSLKLVTSMAFSPDGSRLATACQNSIKLWDVVSGQEVYTLIGPVGEPKGLDSRAGKYGSEPKLLAVQFSPDGRRLAACSVNTVLLWNLAPTTPTPPTTDHRPAVWPE